MATISCDPRFQLARALISGRASSNCSSGREEGNKDASREGGGGPEAAIDIFATLLEISSRKEGETSLNAALCRYEYGNALFRAAVRKKDLMENNGEDNNVEGRGGQEVMHDEDEKKPAAKIQTQREIMAAAALKRSAADVNPPSSSAKRLKIGNGTVECKPGPKQGFGILGNCGGKLSSADDDEVKIKNTEDCGETNEGDDVTLALEMMETSFDMLITQNEDSPSKNEQRHREQQQWALGQLPRVLVCIGDLHSFCGRFGNAVDAYCRALPYREEAWKCLKAAHGSNGSKTEFVRMEVDDLQCQRRLVETYALVAEALLSCPKGEDVVCYYDNDDNEKGEGTSVAANGFAGAKISKETKGTVLVPAKERMSFAESHYEMAREGLEELLYRMGEMASAKMDIGNEKKDIGYLVMMLVGIGNTMKDG